MSALLEAAADDDLALLFEEVEDDNEFADEVDPEVEEDEGLESSDDDDDQGPNATNDYEGEQQLQKDERKKRKHQNDLRFQTLRKRVKIDPMAINAPPVAPPRPKKKSERISWIPTVEDGPTRQSSRRQTMVNKEMTHARLKDSQEKRVRIIATMKEAEKRKAHLKPKKMTQEDHLAEAARVERLNSKSLNRWEQTERRKADERRARIEALQNRRLEGPVISYWSGVATWTNGRLTRVGHIDIKPKPDKEEAKKKKKEKEDKEKAAADQLALQSIPVFGPAPFAAPTQPPSYLNLPIASTGAPAASITPGIPSQPIQTPTDQRPPGDKPPETPATLVSENKDIPVSSAGTTGNVQPSSESQANATIPPENDKGDVVEMQTPEKETNAAELPSEKDEKADPAQQPKQTEKRLFAVEIPARRLSGPQHDGSAQTEPEPTSTKNDDAMHIDQHPAPADVLKDNQAQEPVKANLAPSDNAGAQPVSAQEPKADAAGPAPQGQPPADASQPVKSATPVGTGVALAPHISTTTVSSATVPENAFLQTQNQQTWPELQPPNGMGPIPSAPVQSAIPSPPPVIEHTGRTLTILENFDHATAHSRKYSMYFNAKKPPRLTSMSHHILQITSHLEP
jgi:vacuolar protein sorting-associated protein 72